MAGPVASPTLWDPKSTESEPVDPEGFRIDRSAKSVSTECGRSAKLKEDVSLNVLR